MECKWTECTNQARAKSPFCSDTCSKRFRRANPDTQPGQIQPGQTDYVRLDGKTVYGRQAVHYDHYPEFDTRPEPRDSTDEPVANNRGRYKRTDGSVYQFDVRGLGFECKHPFTDRQGKPHLAVYEPVAAVQVAAGGP